MKIKKLIKTIEMHYSHHGVHVKAVYISGGGKHNHLIFKLKIKMGTKVDKIFECAPDIRAALQMFLFQPFRQGGRIYLAVSEKYVMQNSLCKMIRSQPFRNSKKTLLIALGYDMMGRMVFADLYQMPHIMYAGSTNSGKSVGLICLIISLIIKQPVKNVNLIIFDVGVGKMGIFDSIPYLSHPVIKDVETGTYVIRMLVQEMEERIKMDPVELRTKPAIVFIMDEFLSFIDGISNKKQENEVICEISDLLRRGRHANIHMVLAAQNPTQKNMRVDVSNITVRIAFACAKHQNSETILGEGGAEKLTGKGAALLQTNEYPNPIYLQGAYITTEKLGQLVDSISSVKQDLSNKFVIPELEFSQLPVPTIEDVGYILKEEVNKRELAKIIMWTLGKCSVSVNQIKDQFSMGNRANDIVDIMFNMGIISGKFAKQPRKVIPQSVGEISEETIRFLDSNGFNIEAISAAIKNRS